MTYVPHLRVTALGRLGELAGAEQFSFGFALDRVDPQAGPLPIDANMDVWEDLADDISDFFTASDTGIHEDAHLTMVKIARIDANGRYDAPPIEIARDHQGAGNAVRPPNSVALAVTLKTDGDLGRVKGRFYLPIPHFAVEEDGRYPAIVEGFVESSAETLLNNVNNQPGFDVLGLRVVVASQGRRNKDGSVRRPPTNHDVVGVSVGRVPDTIRRRRNRLVEQHTYRTLAS